MRLTCYLFILTLFGSTDLLAQSAFPVTLSNPMDFDTIIETEPNFVWQTNISVLQSDPRCSQRYVLCELEENQLKGDAIAINKPILVLENYLNTMYSYSSTTNPLEEGHTYVWQIYILFNNMIVDQSEPYQFTILEPKDPLPNFYPVAFKNDGQMFSIVNDQIGLLTDETGNLDLKIHLSKAGKIVKTVYLNELLGKEEKTDQVSEYKGVKRFYVLNLKDLDLEKGTYKASWTMKAKKQYVFNFTIDK
ncbi:hypothetical protein D3C87_181020 [compost metagenome]